MTSFLSVLPVVLRRFAANVRLTAAVVIGAVLAAALLSTTSIYQGAIEELGLRYALREAGPDALNLSIRSSGHTAQRDFQEDNRDAILDRVRGRAAGLVEGTTFAARTSTFFPAPPGQRFPEEDSRPRSHLQYFEGLEEHVRIVEGRLPADARPPAEGRSPEIEVAIGAETAARLGVEVGRRFDLFPFWALEDEPLHVTVVGIIEPLDPDEPYWLKIEDAFTYPSSGWDTLPFFITEATLFDSVGIYQPGMSTDYWNLVYLDTSGISTDNAEAYRVSITSLGRELNTIVPRTTMQTDLPAVLGTYDEKLFFTRIPLLVLVLQIAAIVLYYLFMVSTMLVERQAGEIALLKSRGATTAQVMQIYAVEGLFVFAAALGLGPPLAAAVISFLGRTPPFESLSGGSSLQVELTGEAYLWAAAGAVLAYATLLWPAYQASRRTVIQQRAAVSRPPKQPAFTRYYLDLALVGIGAVLFYQLDRSGSLTTERLFGDQQIDPVRLLTPAFFILTVGIVFLRLFPVFLRGLSWLVARLQGSAVLIGMWQLVRNPVHYSRLVLLLMLATAVGTFAASFGATLDRSYADRAAYEAGAGLRLADVRSSDAPGPDELAAEVAEATGAANATAVARVNGSVSPSRARFTTDSTRFELLAVDPEVFPEVALFRDDFAGQAPDSLLEQVALEPQSASILLPPDARWLGFWFDPVQLRGRIGLELELKDATGRFFLYQVGQRFGAELEPGWHFVSIDLHAPNSSFGQTSFAETPPRGPLSIESISVRYGTRVSLLEGAFRIDDLQTSSAGPAGGIAAIEPDPDRSSGGLPGATVVYDFESLDAWQPLAGLTSDPQADELRAVQAGGSTVAELSWRETSGFVLTHGLQPRRESVVVPVVASRGFLEQSGASIGDVFQVSVANTYFDVRIVDDFSLFPTLADPRREASLVAGRDAVLQLINANPRNTTLYPDEVWLDPGPGTVEAVRDLMAAGRLQANLVGVDQLREQQEQDPLVAAGWEGILFISFAAILLLSAIGFLIYSYLTAQRRTLEFAILRTMGFSRLQIATVVGFEQFFVIGLGMAAGTLLGLRLGTLMIRYMGVTETGDDVVPPMILHVSWETIASAWLVLGLAFLVTIAIVVLLYSRLALHRVLRIGES